MDPLGAKPQTMDLKDVVRWGATEPADPPTVDSSRQLPNAHVISPFPVREDLNNKIALWYALAHLIGQFA